MYVKLLKILDSVYREKFNEHIALTELLSSVKYNIKDPELYCVVLWLWSSAMSEVALSFLFILPNKYITSKNCIRNKYQTIPNSHFSIVDYNCKIFKILINKM